MTVTIAHIEPPRKVCVRKVIHIAPPADHVQVLMHDLFRWLVTGEEHS